MKESLYSKLCLLLFFLQEFLWDNGLQKAYQKLRVGTIETEISQTRGNVFDNTIGLEIKGVEKVKGDFEWIPEDEEFYLHTKNLGFF